MYGSSVKKRHPGVCTCKGLGCKRNKEDLRVSETEWRRGRVKIGQGQTTMVSVLGSHRRV